MHRRRSHRLSTAAAATLLLSTGGVLLAPTASAESGGIDRPITAACSARVCLVVLDPKSDRDGDGAADVDEEQFGTDPDDPTSVPNTVKMLDTLFERRLASFESNLTEIVALPERAPDGTALRTGLGDFTIAGKGIRDGDGALLKSIGVFVEDLGRNGYEALFGLLLKGVPPADTTPAYPFHQPTETTQVNPAWYASGLGYPVLHGANEGKQVAEERLGTKDQPFIKYYGNGSHGSDTGGESRWEKIFTDGSKDVNKSSEEKGRGVTTWTKSVTSYDKNGNKTGETSLSGKMWTDSDGVKHETYTHTEPITEGTKVVGTVTVSVHQETKTNGDVKTTTETTKVYNDGRDKETTKVEKVTPATEAKKEKEEKTEGKKNAVDPDHIDIHLTPVDWHQLETKLNLLVQPVPDEEADEPGPAPEWQDGVRCTPTCEVSPGLVRIDPDGVVVVSAAGEPRFDLEQPCYGNWIDLQPEPVRPQNPPAGGGPGGNPVV